VSHDKTLGRWRGRVGGVALGLGLAGGVASAQDAGTRPEPSVSPPAAPSTKRPIDAAAIAAWKQISAPALSRDGAWFGYVLGPREGESELILRSTKSDEVRRYPVGDGGGQLAFSADSRWLLFLRAPDHAATQRLRRAGQPARTTLMILELATGRTAEIDHIRSFTLDGPRSRIAVLEPDEGPAPGEAPVQSIGRDRILYDLASGTRRRLANVGEWAFDSSGRWLAWTVDAEAQRDGGLHLRDLERGVDRVLDADRALYRGLRWSDGAGDGVAVLKGVPDTARADTLYALLGYTGLAQGTPNAFRLQPENDAAFPRGFTIGATQPLQWAADRDALFFGIRPVRERPTRDSVGPAEKPGVVLWHWNEPRLQSQQQIEQAQDEAYTYLSVYHLQARKFARLADDGLRDVQPAPKDRWALSWDVRAYQPDNSLRGRHYADLYAIDVRTGARRLLLRRYLLVYGMWRWYPKRYFFSPDGVHVLTWANGGYTVHDMATGRSRPLLSKGGPSFGDQPYDYTPDAAPIAPRAWAEGGRTVILSDGWDLWAVPIKGGTPVNLTVNGRRSGIKYWGPAYWLMGAGYGATLDLSQPWYTEAKSHWTKETGYVRIDGRKPGAQRVLWHEARLPDAMKAQDADVVVFARETAVEHDYYLTDLTFAKARKITDANPQQKELLWPSGTMLVDYKGLSGERLQASLLLPANYQKGKRYPAIMDIYERETHRRSAYSAPSDDAGGAGVHPTLYASRGYVIISPDIHYLRDRPGTSALHCVLAAARAAVAAGVVDSTRVGLAGHSMGGYETAFIATQTSFFRAALAAAAPTDLVSLYGGIYWTTGTMESEIFESAQHRITKPYWRDLQTYIRESPVFHVDQVTTPMLLVHNDRDDAVDWRQGLELYNALRRAKKPSVLLQYVGKGHETSGTANQRDLARRAREFFDHFLMGAPAPGWWTEGVGNDRHRRERHGQRKGVKD